MRKIKPGDVLHLTGDASPQFAATSIRLRVIRELVDRHPPHGWTWIEGYQLGARDQAVAKRELFVLREGLRWATPPCSPGPRRQVHSRAGATR
ncbi:hypothetical protein K7640_12735 [Micromonospora sp. PLK6-60]|uniref:hypothetical protein n=1 Tax=Micromonospora sp. PLK6-60 TaxID=2873383 RepID=UPI001CA7505A|nr:hypothetical protein [Micromonospora sp. PLK6-60]MBY8872701.1 hypothetical protein [Micromonospora sp. PLK6-60]